MLDWGAIRAVVAKDWTAVRRAKAVVIPMAVVPMLLLVLLPLVLGLVARGAAAPGADSLIHRLPGTLQHALRGVPARQQLLVLVDGYLLAPLFLIVPLMVASVLAADALAGEKERRTLEGLLHLPIADRDLFVAKVITAFVPAVAVSWAGFLLFCGVADAVGWPVTHRLILPTPLWSVVIFWVAPGVAALGMGIMVRVSARARTTQEANQLGGAVVLPLIFLAVGQSAGLLLVTLPVALAIGAGVWLVALALLARGAQRFTRDRVAGTL
jgi:ABC-type transport system involved in multi-copper enzyme maturation permease subunit